MIPEIGTVEGVLQSIDEICNGVLAVMRTMFATHEEQHSKAPWSYGNIVSLEKTIRQLYGKMGMDVDKVFTAAVPQIFQQAYKRAKDDLSHNGIQQNLIGEPDERKIRHALESIYTNVAMRTDKMTQENITSLRQFSAKIFREASITGETRTAVTQRLIAEAGTIPGFLFIAIDGRHWKDRTYFEMLARTELMNNARSAYDDCCVENGYDIMKLSVSGGNVCSHCQKYERKCFTIGPNDLGLPTKDQLIAEKVFHPNCTHSYSAVPEFIFKRDYEKDGTPKKGYNSRGYAEEQAAKAKKKAEDKKATHADILKRNPALYAKTEKYMQSLSPDERDLLYRYTNSDEYHFSNYLRAEKESKHFRRTYTLDKKIQQLNTILENAPKWDGDELYRGMSFNSQKDLDQFLDRQVNSGKPIYFGFCSSTYDINSTEKYMQKPYKVMIHIVKPKHGALLADYSAVPDDREVLFPENISFQPIEKSNTNDILKKDENGIIHIYVKEVVNAHSY